MISDRFPLTGPAAYLLGPTGNVDLAGSAPPGSPPGPLSGKSLPIGEHRILDIDSIDLLFTGGDLTKLLHRQTTPIIEVHVSKELFPQLLTDPYKRRVHTIGGADDFRRGILSNCRVMAIEGRATLVSEGTGAAKWVSPRYVFDEPLTIAELAWEFSQSRLTPSSAFDYDLTVDLWDRPAGTLVQLPSIPVAAGASATAVRSLKLPTAQSAAAVQVTFSARANREAAIEERHAAEPFGQPLGIPLLQAIHLLEQRDSQMVFHSLHELNVGSKEFTLYGSGNAPLTAGIARLNLRAALTGADAIEVRLPPSVFLNFEARLSASIIDRSPVTHR